MTILWHGGVTRLVILTKHWAIKFPTPMYGWKFFLYGFLANMQEREWAGFDKRLCPVLRSSKYGIFVIMPRCQPLTDDEFTDRIHDGWLRLSEEATNESVELPVELKTCSFGWLNGKIVAIDYGGCGRRGRTTRTIASLYSE